MLPLKRISGVALRCMVYYGLLVAPWPGVMDGYRAFFRAGGNFLFHSFGSAGSVSFEAIPSHDHAKDTTLVLTKQTVTPSGPRTVRGEMDIKCVYIGYRPTAFLVALVLAAPVPWPRRLWALMWGLVLVNAFVAFRVTLQLLDAFSGPNLLALFSLGRSWKITLKILVLIFFRAPEMHYIVPAFIWIMVTFRRGDLRRLYAE